jgi:hypothetical protein
MKNLTDKQKKTILYAYLDLKGSLESPKDHDYENHKNTIKDMETEFPFLLEQAPDNKLKHV